MMCASRLSVLAALLLGTYAGAVPAMSLTEALQRAQEHDPAAITARAQYEAERESSAVDRGERLPTLGASGGYAYAKTESDGVFGSSKDDYPTWSGQIEARQALFRLDWFALGDRARALDDQAEINYRDRTLEILQRVAERYFGVLLAQDELEQARAEARAVRESLEDTRKRYEVELVPGTDLKEAQARDDLAQARLLSAQTRLLTAQDALDEITGNGYVVLPQLPGEEAFPPLEPAEMETWIEAVRRQNPSVLLAEQAVIIARADRKSRLAAAMPQLDLVASAGRQDSSEYEFGQQQDDARIGVELSVPIYAGGVTRALLRQADANVRAAEAQQRQVLLETERSARQQYRTVQTAYREVDAYRRSLESALAAQQATRAGYDAGTRTITDVLDAQSRVVQTRRDLNNTRYNLLLSLLQLRQLIGELSAEDFARIDQLLLYPPAH